MDKKELAIAKHDIKFNCAQAVACAFAEEVGVDEKVLFTAMEGFGFGMGGAEGTCGALSGAIALAGFKNSDGNLTDPGTKAETYKLSKEMVTKFTEKCGSTVCKELKGLETGTPLCSCPDCICKGVEVVQEVLGL
ncbi:MAG: C_GCAxxG_C_C family protein [Lachnospiraceae bacterium]|nr:C_GCAxxG_C_C family protein [Lachnospiraceae bacterium]